MEHWICEFFIGTWISWIDRFFSLVKLVFHYRVIFKRDVNLECRIYAFSSKRSEKARERRPSERKSIEKSQKKRSRERDINKRLRVREELDSN